MTVEKPSERKRLAIFTNNDLIWSLPTWDKTIPALLAKHDIVALYLFPEKMGKLKGFDVYKWYWSVFGVWNFIKIGLFALSRRLRQTFSGARNWNALAKKYNIPLLQANSPNDTDVIQWTRNNNIDIIFIMVNHILKNEIISAPKIGIINKHAALLPSCKGVFPYFWGKLKNLPTGISFHQVDVGIDTGRPLVQNIYQGKGKKLSMLRFYADIYSLYSELAPLAVERLIRGEFIEPRMNLPTNYFGFPTRDDYLEFRRLEHLIARVSDAFYNPKPDEVMDEIRRL